jgi:SAM-dependent methyltransferase
MFRRAKWSKKHLAYLLLDLRDWLTGKKGELTPPRRMWDMVGGDNFNKIGQQFLSYFMEFGELRPEDDVLDVGCGIGRMAVPLTKYLNPGAVYEGLDVDPKSIDWCRRKISSLYPSFHFQVIDVFSKMYNPNGKLESSNYRFPFSDESFDFVFLVSVFTHMLPLGIRNYLSEIHRVMRKGGRCLVTCFLLNRESDNLLGQGLGTFKFQPRTNAPCRIVNPDVPDAAVAIDEDWLRLLCNEAGLVVVDPIHYGFWVGRVPDIDSHQDIVVTRRES